MEDKPLFVPLTAFWYDAIASGHKTTEYRAYGPRWNERTCYTGRPVTFSRGYGKAKRLSAVIESVDIDAPQNQYFTAIYGNDKRCIAIKFNVIDTQTPKDGAEQ